MKVYTEYLLFNTKKRRELIRITDKVKEAVKKSGVKEGLCLVSAMHLTAAVIIQDDEEGLHEDIWEWLERLAPFRSGYKHHRTGEDNGDAHLKNLLVHL
jgi:secondary thiamine-phosphate synthase enzyme